MSLSYVYKKNCKRSMEHMSNLEAYEDSQEEEISMAKGTLMRCTSSQGTFYRVVQVDTRVQTGIICFWLDIATLNLVATSLGKQYPGRKNRAKASKVLSKYVLVMDGGAVYTGGPDGYTLEQCKKYAKEFAKHGKHGVIRSQERMGIEARTHIAS